jgi:Domain of unknown function (DUF5666)
MIRFLAVLAICSAAYAQNSQLSSGATLPPQSSAASHPDGSANALLPNLAPLPRGKSTLIGGMLRGVDRVQDQLLLDAFGGQKMKVSFDERTLIYRGRARASQRDLHNGDRVYVETVLDGSSVFARSIRLMPNGSMGECHGQVISYDRGRGELTLRSTFSPAPVTLQVSSSTPILRKGQEPSAQLEPGTLVDVQFQPNGSGAAVARQISILASPGTAFTFQGQVTYLDIHQGMLSLTDAHNQRRYDIFFSPGMVTPGGSLREGSNVTVTAGLNGSRYVASSITVSAPSSK